MFDNFKNKTGIDFHEFYEKTYNKTLFFTNRYYPNIDNKEDIIQDAYIRLVKKIDNYDNTISQLYTYFNTILKNELIFVYNNTKHKCTIDSILEETFISDEEETDVEEKDKTYKDMFDKIDSILKKSNHYERNKKIIELIKQGKRYKAIAEELDITENIVKQLIFKLQNKINKIPKDKTTEDTEKRKAAQKLYRVKNAQYFSNYREKHKEKYKIYREKYKKL